jgi:hypothetical protein
MGGRSFDHLDPKAIVPSDGENFTVPVMPGKLVEYDPPEEYNIKPTLLKTNRGGIHTRYDIGGDVMYLFNQPSPYCLVMRSDHLAHLLYKYGPSGIYDQSLSVVDPKDWPTEFIQTTKAGDQIKIPLNFKTFVASYKDSREKEHARMFPDFAGKGKPK